MNTTLPKSDDEIRDLAERIAQALRSETQPPDRVELHESIIQINQRLENLERAMLDAKSAPVQLQHPSIDKFSVPETIVDEIFSSLNKEKACQFEPDKPCDHCSMCNSRGF